MHHDRKQCLSGRSNRLLGRVHVGRHSPVNSSWSTEESHRSLLHDIKSEHKTVPGLCHCYPSWHRCGTKESTTSPLFNRDIDELLKYCIQIFINIVERFTNVNALSVPSKRILYTWLCYGKLFYMIFWKQICKKIFLQSCLWAVSHKMLFSISALEEINWNGQQCSMMKMTKSILKSPSLFGESCCFYH